MTLLAAKREIRQKFEDNKELGDPSALPAMVAEAYDAAEFIRTQCFRKPELLRRNANGDRLKFPMAFALKMEQLLDAAVERRRRTLTQMKLGCDIALADATVEIPEKHMQRMWQLRLLRDVF